MTKPSQPPVNDDGFTLIETLIAMAITSALMLVLFSTLTALTGSQDRVAKGLDFAADSVFDAALLNRLFSGLESDYKDEPAVVTGTERSLSVRSRFDGNRSVREPAVLAIVETNGQYRLDLTFRGQTLTLQSFGTAPHQFVYYDLDGERHQAWDSVTRQPSRPNLIPYLTYAQLVPQSIVIAPDSDPDQLIYKTTLSPLRWPPPRPNDKRLIVERQL